MPSNHIVRVNNLTKTYKNKLALDHVSFEIPERRIFGILGENGAGKTTIMRCILGLQHYDEGYIEVLGRKIGIDTYPDYAQIGALIEEPSVYLNLTAYENMSIYTDYKRAQSSQIPDLLEMVGLVSVTHKKVGGFSQGMRQRLGIALALIGQPKLIVLDEPINGLDPSGIRELRELIKLIPDRLNATVIISSHILAEMQKICSDIMIIKDGRVLLMDKIDQIKDNFVIYERIGHDIDRNIENLPDLLIYRLENRVLALIRRQKNNESNEISQKLIENQFIERFPEAMLEHIYFGITQGWISRDIDGEERAC